MPPIFDTRRTGRLTAVLLSNKKTPSSWRPCARIATKRIITAKPLALNGDSCAYSAVVGSITELIREIRLAGKPLCSACLRTVSSSGATYTQ